MSVLWSDFVSFHMKLHFCYFHYLRYEILVLLGASVIIFLFFFVKEHFYIVESISVTCLICPVSLLAISGYLSVLEECIINIQIHFLCFSLLFVYVVLCAWLIHDRQIYVDWECCLLHFFLLDPIFCSRSVIIWWLPCPHVPNSYFTSCSKPIF